MSKKNSNLEYRAMNALGSLFATGAGIGGVGISFSFGKSLLELGDVAFNPHIVTDIYNRIECGAAFISLGCIDLFLCGASLFGIYKGLQLGYRAVRGHKDKKTFQYPEPQKSLENTIHPC